MELNQVSFPDLHKLGTVLWLRGYNSVQSSMLNSGMLRKLSISESSGNTREFSEMDTNEYMERKPEGQDAGRAKVTQGYSKTMTKYRIAENIGITYEMIHENKYPEVIQQFLTGGQKAVNSIDLDLTHRFTFGTAVSYTERTGELISITTGDSLQLFYTAHTLKQSATTYRNRLATNPRFSRAALEGMERLVTEETYNQYGEKKTIPFDILWFSDDPNTENAVHELLKSSSSPDAINSGVTNVYAGKYKLVKLPRLATTAAGAPDSTKRYYWGIASSILTSFWYGEWESPHMTAPEGTGIDTSRDVYDYTNRAGYGMCIAGAGWVKMSSGDGAA